MKFRLTIMGVALAALACGLVIDAGADSIYMKNGRIIRSSGVRVEGDRVFVRLYNGEVVIPLDRVERIVEDDEVEVASSRPLLVGDQPTASGPETGDAQDPTAATGEDPDDPAATDPSIDDPDAGTGTDAAAEPEEPAAPAPEETREYWQNRIRPLNEQLDRLDARLQGLRSRTSADVRAQIERVETQRAQVQSQLETIIREGRQRGVPPGWLR